MSVTRELSRFVRDSYTSDVLTGFRVFAVPSDHASRVRRHDLSILAVARHGCIASRKTACIFSSLLLTIELGCDWIGFKKVKALAWMEINTCNKRSCYK